MREMRILMQAAHTGKLDSAPIVGQGDGPVIGKSPSGYDEEQC